MLPYLVRGGRGYRLLLAFKQVNITESDDMTFSQSEPPRGWLLWLQVISPALFIKVTLAYSSNTVSPNVFIILGSYYHDDPCPRDHFLGWDGFYSLFDTKPCYKHTLTSSRFYFGIA